VTPPDGHRRPPKYSGRVAADRTRDAARATSPYTTIAPRALDRPPRADLALIALGVAMVSTSAPLIRAAGRGAPAMSIAMWRNALACLVIVPFALLTRREELRGLTRVDWLLCVGGGLVLAAHFATWVPSIGFTTIASATALVATQPVWAALIARFRGERVARRGWIGIVVAVLGAGALSGLDFAVSGRAVWGDILAIAGGMLAGAYVTIGGTARQRVSTTVYTALCYSTAAVALLVVCAVGSQPLTGFNANTWLAIGGLTVGAQLFGHSVFNHVLKTTSATFVSLAILFEVAGSVLLAGIFYDEWPSLAVFPAAALMIGGIVTVVRAGRRPEVSGVPVME
jgi:drug/metabolite transporter (DMT)-like permease